MRLNGPRVKCTAASAYPTGPARREGARELHRAAGDEAKPYVHFGATSYDVGNSFRALQMKLAIDNVVAPRLKALVETLIDLTDRYADTTQNRRYAWAVPITFGFAMAECLRQPPWQFIAGCTSVEPRAAPQFSGAVGAYNALSLFVDDPLKFEQAVMAKVGLEPLDADSAAGNHGPRAE